MRGAKRGRRAGSQDRIAESSALLTSKYPAAKSKSQEFLPPAPGVHSAVRDWAVLPD